MNSVRMPLRRLASGGSILCFHSVTTPDLPARGEAHVSVSFFKSVIRLARRVGELVPLSELVQRHSQGASTSGLIAVTLDDAYAAVKTALQDFLSREAVPVTVFAVSGAASEGTPFWWDRIDDVFPCVDPARWRAFETACGLPDDYRRGQAREYGPLRPLRQWLLATYAGRWPAHLESPLRTLEREAGIRTVHRAMTLAELTDLVAATPSIEIGVHTVSHPVLPLLSNNDLKSEIAVSYETLRERFPTTVPVLAVPFGLYDERTIRIARAAGMTASLTLAGSLLTNESPEQALPRFCLNRRDTRSKLALRLFGVPQFVHRWSGQQLAPYPALPSATT